MTAPLLDRTVPATPLAIVRIAAGVAAVPLALNTRTNLLQIARPETLDVPMAEWLPAVTSGPINVLIGLWLAATALVIVGHRARAWCLVVATCASAAAVWDVQTLSNHQTLLIVLCLLLSMSQCTATLSLDAHRVGPVLEVPYWPIFLIRTQITSMYGFTALAKLTTSFLSGAVLRESVLWLEQLPADGGEFVVRGLVAATIGIELFLAIGLWFRPTRLVAVVVGVLFHMGILISIPGLSHELAPFAALTLSTYLLFLSDDLDLPSSIARRLRPGPIGGLRASMWIGPERIG